MTEPIHPLSYDRVEFRDAAAAVLIDYPARKHDLSAAWDRHVELINETAETRASGNYKKAKKLENKLLDSTEFKTVMLVLQMPLQWENGEYAQITYAEALPLIKKVDPRLFSGEPVRVILDPKISGGFRPIVSFGPLQRANQLACRTVLECRYNPSSYEYNRTGRGRFFAINEIAKVLEKEGYNYVAIADIKDAYGSVMREAIRKSNLLPESMVLNACFIPENTKIICADELFKIAVQNGLPQGSMVSGFILQKFLEPIFKKLGFVNIWCYGDDILIVAKTKEEAFDKLGALESSMMNLPTGPLTLKTKQVYEIGEPMNYLGFWFGRMKDGSIRILPSNEGYRRTYIKVARKLILCDPSKWDILIHEHFCNWAWPQKVWPGRLGGAFNAAAGFESFVLPKLYQAKILLKQNGKSFSDFESYRNHACAVAEDCVPDSVIVSDWKSTLQGNCMWWNKVA